MPMTTEANCVKHFDIVIFIARYRQWHDIRLESCFAIRSCDDCCRRVLEPTNASKNCNLSRHMDRGSARITKPNVTINLLSPRSSRFLTSKLFTVQQLGHLASTTPVVTAITMNTFYSLSNWSPNSSSVSESKFPYFH